MSSLPLAKRTPSMPADLRDFDTKAPGALLLLLEGRAPVEFFSLVASWPWMRKLPHGDGHPVLVFPGMGANDATTVPLRHFLRELGYETQAWGQGLNFGPRPGVLERAADDLRALADKQGRAVSLIGWSLGGIYAREMAKLYPELVRSVITLGTPFTGHPKATNAWRIYELLTGTKIGNGDALKQIRGEPPVPTTSIYSRTDGIVSWHCSLNKPSPIAENIEVQASHVGLGMNPLALYAIADRLAQPVGEWKSFDATGARRWFFKTGLPDIAKNA